MDINNPTPITQYIQEKNGSLLFALVLDIGPWNMDDNGILNIALPAGLNCTNIRIVQAWIREDASDLYRYPIDEVSAATGLVAGGVWVIENNWIRLHRTNGGAWDNAGYSSVAFSRGKVTVFYSV